MKGLKEFIKAKKLNEDKITVIHTKNGKVDYIEKGEMVGGRLIRDAGIDFKDFVGMDPEEAKNALVKFSRFDPKNIIIEGCKKVQEAGNIKMHRNIDNVDVIIEPDGSYTFWKDNGKTKGAQNRSLHGQQGAVKELGALGYKVANSLNEAWMPDSQTITWLKDYLRDVKRGEGWVDIDKVVYDADVELNKDLSKNKKDLADYIKRIGGGSILKEATSNLREGFGELEVYTSFGPGFGVQIYPSRNGELTAHVGYVGNGSGNGTRKKELKTETEMAAQDQIKVSDLKQIEKVLKKHLDALDSDLDKILKQLGYK